MSNFDFVQKYDAELAQKGRLAEELLYDAPVDCSGTLRKIAETLAERACRDKRIVVPADPTAKGQQSFIAVLKALQSAGAVPTEVLEDFYRVCQNGNPAAIKSQEEEIEDAKASLAATYRIAAWFVSDHKGFDIYIAPFALPKRSTNEHGEDAKSSTPPQMERDATMSNFEFLRQFDANLALEASRAEKYLYDDPKTCCLKMRFIAEELVKQTVKEKRIPVPSEPSDRPSSNISLDRHLKALKNTALLREGIYKDFDLVRDIGNRAVHPGSIIGVEDAKDSLAAGYRFSVWYVCDFKRSSQTIPEFVLPTQQTEEGKKEQDNSPWLPKPESLLNTPFKRWAFTILSAIGLGWLVIFYLDPEHRPDVALVKVTRLTFVLLAIALLVLPAMVLAHGMSLWALYRFFSDSLSQELGWNQYLIQPLVLVFLLPFVYAVKMFASPLNKQKRWLGSVLLVIMAIGYNLMFYYATKDGPTPKPIVKYYEPTDEGCIFYDRGGYSPTTHLPLLPVTPDVIRMCKTERGPMVPVDAATHDWFNPNTGAPMLWYSLSSGGKNEYFLRSGTNPRTGDPVLPVTRELQKIWVAESTPKPPKPVQPVTQEDILSQILHPAVSGGPGVLLLDVTANDQSGVDALSRHLSGVNTSAFPAAALTSYGLAGKFHQGDARLVSKALAITHLSSLVIAEVKTECAKKSSLDPDLLTCDVTVDARRFDAQGNLAGSTLARGIGVGFNQADAMEQAAQRASGDLIKLARR